MNLNWGRINLKQPYQGQQKQGFTLTYIPHLDSILMFGGSHIKTNQVHLYHLSKTSWSVQKTSYPKKMSRKYHSAAYEQSIRALIVFGGEAERGRSLDSLDALFIDDWKWRKLALKNSPPPRQYHTITKLQSGNYLIFGGITLPFGTFLNDLWVIRKINQIRDISTLQILGCQASQVITKGHRPSGRHSHQSYSFGNNFYVIGGEEESYEQSFTIYSLNIKQLSWHKHSFNMTVPQLKNCSQIINPQKNGREIFIFGGFQTNTKKQNRDLYSLQFLDGPKLKHLSHISNQIPSQFLNNSCGLPFEQICGVSCSFVQGSRMIVSRISLEDHHPELSIEDYLKQIKSEQILSQELLKKSQSLELLYKEIQSYISTLYGQYQEFIDQQQFNDDEDFDEEEFEMQQIQIENQKKNQIEECVRLKKGYIKIDKIYQQNLMLLKNARNQLAALNQNFQGCMETERDEQI